MMIFLPYIIKNCDNCNYNLNRASNIILSSTDMDNAPYTHLYLFTVCRNGVTFCNNSSVMVTQSRANNPSQCFFIGRWDETINPIYSNNNNGSFTFVYSNGDSSCGQPHTTFIPTFQCKDADVEYELGPIVKNPVNCKYQVTINTKYACVN